MWLLHDDWQWFSWPSGSCWFWTFSPNIYCCQVQEVCMGSLYKMLLKKQYIYVKSHQKGKTIKDICNKNVIWWWCMKLVNSVGRVQVLYKWVRVVCRLPSFCVSLHMTNWWKKTNAVIALVHADWWLTMWEMAEYVEMFVWSCFTVLIENSGMWLVSAKFIPQLLVVEEKEYQTFVQTFLNKLTRKRMSWNWSI